MLKLIEQVAEGSVDGEEVVEKAKKATPRQRSRLGTMLSESITRKVIILILLFFRIVPQLVYTDASKVDAVAARSLTKYSSQGAALEIGRASGREEWCQCG